MEGNILFYSVFIKSPYSCGIVVYDSSNMAFGDANVILEQVYFIYLKQSKYVRNFKHKSLIFYNNIKTHLCHFYAIQNSITVICI